MVGVDLRIQDVWAKQAYSVAGTYLGVVEAVGFRHGTVHRVGVPMRNSDRRGLVFFSVEGARLDGDRLILAVAD
ncbi:MAG TPA: hypothetical protein VNU19_11795 [Candidatus Acidoferrum sp.]|nr:hypothetical protein [Candidatus Acidoferrum sp.]